MTILDTFYLLFDSDASKLDKGLEETEKKSDKLIDKLKGVDKEGTKAGAVLYDLIGKGAGLLGVGLSIGALVAGVKATAAAYDELGKLAARFRSTTDAIDEFVDASALLGISEETSVGALKALDVAVQDTALGLGRAKKVFEEIGVAATDATGKARPTVDVMGDLASALKDMERGKQIRVMERLGLDPSLLKLFNADFVELQKRMGGIDRASGFNLDQAVKRAAEFTKASKGMSLEVNTLKMYMDKLSEGLKLSTMPFFTDAIKMATGYVKTFTDFLMKHKNFVQGFFVAAGAAITYYLIPAAIKGAVAVWAMIAPFALIGLAVAAVGTAFALLYDDIVTFMEGGDSLIGQILDRWPMIGKVAAGIADAVKSMWSVIEWVFGVISDVIEISIDGWKMLFSVIGNTAPFKAAGQVIETLLQTLSGAFDVFGDAAGAAWDFVIDKIKTAIGFISEAIELVKSVGGKISGSLGGVKADIKNAQGQLGIASSSGLASQTSNSINNSRIGNRTTQVNVASVEVKTAATDAGGIAKALGDSMQAQMRQAASNYDDGVLA